MSDRQTRAEERRQRAVLRKTSLGAEDDLAPVRGEEAISLVHQLTLTSWSFTGRPLPQYRRADIPCRFVPGRPT